MMVKIRLLSELLRLETTFFLTVLIWRLNHRFGPDAGISEALRAMANQFEPTYPIWVGVSKGKATC
mgnify:CR=1 FL=1